MRIYPVSLPPSSPNYFLTNFFSLLFPSPTFAFISINFAFINFVKMCWLNYQHKCCVHKENRRMNKGGIRNRKWKPFYQLLTNGCSMRHNFVVLAKTFIIWRCELGLKVWCFKADEKFLGTESNLKYIEQQSSFLSYPIEF
jgi:hypothetical protein